MRKFLVSLAFRDDFDKMHFKNEVIESEKFPSKFDLTKKFYGSSFDAFVGISGISEISNEDAKSWKEEIPRKISSGND